MPSDAEITVEQLADELVVDASDVHIILRQHDVHAEELLGHNVTDVRNVLDPDGERTSHFTVIGDGQLYVSLEGERVALLRAAAQHVGRLTTVPSELGNTIARTLYAVGIELNNKRALPIEVRRAAVSLAEQVLLATQTASSPDTHQRSWSRSRMTPSGSRSGRSPRHAAWRRALISGEGAVDDLTDKRRIHPGDAPGVLTLRGSATDAGDTTGAADPRRAGHRHRG